MAKVMRQKPQPVKPQNKFGLSTFLSNYEQLRNNILPMSYNHARRMRGPIYDALLLELREAQCYRIERIFRRLLKKEDSILGVDIIYRLSDNPPLLIKLVENVKQADQILRAGGCGSIPRGFKLLYNCITLLEKYSADYEWMLEEFFRIVGECLMQAPRHHVMLEDVKAMFLYKYALYMKKKKDLAKTIALLDKALDACRGSEFRYEDTDKFLHTVVVHETVKVLLTYARTLKQKDPPQAQRITVKALCTLAEVGLENEKVLLYLALSMELECLMAVEKFDVVEQKILKFRQKYPEQHMSRELAEQQVGIYKMEAICKYSLKKYKDTLEALVRAFRVTRKYRLMAHEADLWVLTGRTFALDEETLGSARVAFLAAKINYSKYSNDQKNANMSDFRLGDLKSDETMSLLICNMKSEQYCAKFYLRQWKNLNDPFWHPLMPEDVSVSAMNLETFNPVKFLTQRNYYGYQNSRTVGNARWYDGDTLQDDELKEIGVKKVACLLEEYAGEPLTPLQLAKMKWKRVETLMAEMNKVNKAGRNAERKSVETTN